MKQHQKHYKIKGISDRGIPTYKTPEYQAWYSMQKRCLRTWHKYYRHYGGRGISITPRWLGESGFENFCEDMGQRPNGMSLDRINNDRDYSPDNCRWATWLQQGRNKRVNVGSSGYVGVRKSWSRWRATLYMGKQGISLGTYDTPEEAHHVFKSAREQIRAL